MRSLDPKEYAEYRHWMNIAIDNGMHRKTYYQRVKLLGWNYEDAATKKPNSPRDYDNEEFALYKGEELIMMGTVYEIAEETGKKLSELKNMLSKSYNKRIGKNATTLVSLEDDDMEMCDECSRYKCNCEVLTLDIYGTELVPGEKYLLNQFDEAIHKNNVIRYLIEDGTHQLKTR